MSQNILNHFGVSVLRNGLIAVDKIVVIGGHAHGNAFGNRRIQFFRRYAPLLFIIIQKTFPVDVIRQKRQVGVILLSEFQNGQPVAVSDNIDKFLADSLRHVFGKAFLQTVQIKRKRNRLPVNVSLYFQKKRMPFGKTRQIMPDLSV